MAAFAGWRERPGQQGGTDLAKPSWPRGNIHAETQATTWQGGADPVIGTVGVKADMRYFGKTLKNRFQHDIW